MRMACFFFLFVLLGEDRLQHIAWLGNVREVDLRDNGLRSVARGTSPGVRTGCRILR
jgi:hypothetical protein